MAEDIPKHDEEEGGHDIKEIVTGDDDKDPPQEEKSEVSSMEGGTSGSEPSSNEEVKVRWNISHTAERPVRALCELFGVWLCIILLLGLLSVTAGMIKFEIEVPFYDRDELNQARMDAYKATERDIDYVSTFGQVAGGACVHQDPTVLTRNGTLLQGPKPSGGCQRSTNHFFRLVYIVKDRTSNIITEENLREIQKIEAEFLNHLNLPRNCLLIDSPYPAFETRDVDEIARTLSDTVNDEPSFVSCERINSVLNFLDPMYFDKRNESGLGYYLLPNDQVPQEYDYSTLPEVLEYWKDFDIESYNLTDYDFLVATVGKSITVQNLFWGVTSTEYTLGSSEAIGLTSTYSLGLPMNGYESSTKEKEDQWTEMGEWLWEEFDSFLKSANFGNVEVYWADSENGMQWAEESKLAMESMKFFPLSLLMVLCFLIYMQDSFFISVMGILQILLTFIPSIIVFRYVFQQKYFGVLNLIAVYVILGIGVANLFVFSDQYHNFRYEKNFTIRMQKAWNVAAAASFATSITTCISFISNATSVFPAVSSFGIFAASLVMMNYFAVISFFPAVISVYHHKFRHQWWDRPSWLFCCKKTVPNEGSSDPNSDEQKEYALVRFFKDIWAPRVIKYRYVILLIFAGVFAVALHATMQLDPDEEAPTTLPEGNNYRDFTDIMIDYFARAGNPRNIQVRWVSGIDIDNPIDRSGTEESDIDDYGVANYVDCETYNPTTPEAQVWSLQTCHDLFFGNMTDFHDGDDSFSLDGTNGPKARRTVTENVPLNDYSYYTRVSCPMQGFRDWMLTDTGCEALKDLGLPCLAETSQRQGCSTWDTNGNSCEPFPVPQEKFLDVMGAFLLDETVDPVTLDTNFDRFSTQIFVENDVDMSRLEGDFSCRRSSDGLVLFAMSTINVLDQDFALNYEDGIDLYTLWDTWSKQMTAHGPREMSETMQTDSAAWAFYFLNETLLEETFSGIGLALGLSLVVLVVVTGNILIACYAVFTIGLIVVDVFAFTVWVGWSLGVVEAVNYVVVIGMSIDYTVHMGNAFTSSKSDNRAERVILTFQRIAVSVLSSAVSTLLAIFLMFFAPNFFFVKFASFLFVTILLSCIYSMTFFPALLCVIGPTGNTGDVYGFIRRLYQKWWVSSRKGATEEEAEGVEGKNETVRTQENVAIEEEDVIQAGSIDDCEVVAEDAKEFVSSDEGPAN